MKASLPIFLLACASFAAADENWPKVNAVLKAKCYKCHSDAAKKVKGDLAFDREAEFEAKISADAEDAVIVPGDSGKSKLYQLVSLPADDGDVMPPDVKDHLTDTELALVKTWIDDGANINDHKAVAESPKTAAAKADPAMSGVKNWNGMLDWTNHAGKTLSAQFIRLDKPFVVIRTIDGKDHFYPLEQLSPESQKQAEEAAIYAIPQ